MTGHRVVVAVILVVAVFLSGCVLGPSPVTNSVLCWHQNIYADNTYVGVLATIPAGVAIYFTLVADFFINGYYFWIEDLWDGTGKTYDHKEFPNGRTNEDKYSRGY